MEFVGNCLAKPESRCPALPCPFSLLVALRTFTRSFFTIYSYLVSHSSLNTIGSGQSGLCPPRPRHGSHSLGNASARQGETAAWPRTCSERLVRRLPGSHRQVVGRISLPHTARDRCLVLCWSPPHILRGVPMLESRQILWGGMRIATGPKTKRSGLRGHRFGQRPSVKFFL